MSIVASTCEQISGSQLNLSKAKMLYSFPKAPRFSQYKSPYCSAACYEAANTNSKRGTSLGYGKRLVFLGKDSGPAPTAYEKHSEFESSGRKGKTFGIAREAYKKVYLKSAPYEGKAPGPGTYNIIPHLGESASKYTMRPKTAGNPTNITAKIVPGPGQYVMTPGINPLGHFMFSKYKSSGACVFNPPSSTRFKRVKMGFPGPGNYNLPSGLTVNGSYFFSRFRSSGNVKFYTTSRSLQSKSTSLLTPGPGSYKMPSEFGHYISKTAHIMDAKELRARTAVQGSRINHSQSSANIRKAPQTAPKNPGFNL